MSTSPPKRNRKPLTIREWWDEVGTDNVKKVADELGTSMALMKFYRYRIKRPSYDRAQRIVASARQLTPGFVPDVELMLLPLERRAPRPNYTPSIQPSERFKRSLRARQARSGATA